MTTVFVRRTEHEAVPGQPYDVIIDLLASHSKSNVTHNFEDINKALQPTALLRDLIAVATCVYVCDKKVTRRAEDDGWTRSFRMCLPVSDTGAWRGVESYLTSALSFLTGDSWAFEWRDLDERNDGRDQPRQDVSFNKVALFSGGLDSLIGAIDFLEGANTNMLLVGHHDSTLTTSPQKNLARALADYYGVNRVALLPISGRPAPPRATQLHPLSKTTEPTTRSRSFLFIAVGIAAAHSVSGVEPLYVCENGPIALNVALNESRMGSCSTRTTHPYYLSQLASVLAGIGVNNSIVNPYSLLTKGEMISQSGNDALLHRLAPHSISCSHPEVAHYFPPADKRRATFGATYGNCGYCYPCIIRRAAFHANALDYPKVSGRYLYDVTSDITLYRSNRRMRDARAVFDSFQDSTSPEVALLAGGPVPEHVDVRKLIDVYVRGRCEIKRLFVDKASADVRRIAGL